MSAFPVEENHGMWWLITDNDTEDRMHAVPGPLIDRLDDGAVDELTDYPGPVHTAVCGHRAPWQMPGVFTRMGAPRCAHCCDRLGLPRGTGTPLNEAGRQRRGG